MSEQVLKKRLFKVFVGAKIFVLLILFGLWQLGGFTFAQFLATFGLLLPLFSVYLLVILRDLAKHRYIEEKKQDDKKLKSSFRSAVWIVSAIYILFIILILIGKAKSLYDFATMQSLFSTVETGFGVYVGIVISALYGQDKEKSNK